MRMNFLAAGCPKRPTLFKLAWRKNMSVANAISGCMVYCTYPAHKKYADSSISGTL
jgi:hypothetical protein